MSKVLDESQLATIAGKYSLGRKLGSGSFGDIYLAVNQQTGEELAAKLEKSKCRHPQLLYEAKLLKHLQGVPGIANVYHCDVEGGYNIMVMDLLGPSLENLFNLCHRKFNLKSVLMIAEQMLYRVEYLHSKNFIHRDLKPENFLMGHKRKSNMIYLIDFGLAKKYRDARTQQHMPFKDNRSFMGTARYASINAHGGIEQSRRDDLEAIGYVLMYFNRGQLPWQGLKASSKEEKYHKIMELKRSTPAETLCEDFPGAFTSYLNYCKSLKFEDRPDYAYLRRRFKELFPREGFVNDGVFDWSRPLQGGMGDGEPEVEAPHEPSGEVPGAIPAGPLEQEGGGGQKKSKSRGPKGGFGINPRINITEPMVGAGTKVLESRKTADSAQVVNGAGEGSSQAQESEPAKRWSLASLFRCGVKAAAR